MLLCIILQITPQFITQRIFFIYIRIQDFFDTSNSLFLLWKGKFLYSMKYITVKTYNHYTFPVLRHICLSIHYKIMKRITQFL